MPINNLDPQNAILFLGSGFSAGATNISNEKIPAGDALLKKLAEELRENPADLELKSAADEFAARESVSVYDVLYNTFVVKEILDYHRKILSLPWARIYTTNYDDIVNVVKGATYPIYCFDDDKPRSLPKSFAVHLHGSIRKATEENVDDHLILNSRSYDVITRNYPEWFYEFQRDRQNFDACIFLGFSLNDHHISGLMTSGEESSKKTHFIARPGVRQSFIDRATPYGEVLPIGFEAFADLASSLPPPEQPSDLKALGSFKYLHAGLDSKALADPTSIEIINLVTLGTFNQSRYFNTRGRVDYVAGRDERVSIFMDNIEANKTILVHSRLGNGKTIFSSVVAREAALKGYRCLQWRRAGKRLSQELEFIAAERKILIIFDDYDAAIEHIDRVSSALPQAKFLVTVRSGQQEVRLHEVYAKLPAPIYRLNVDKFSDEDREQLFALLDKAGAHADDLRNIVMTSNEVRDIVTKLYNHAEIRQKISAEVLAASRSSVSILALASLIKWAGVEVDDSFIQELAGKDVYSELRRFSAFTNDFLNLTDDRVEMRSGLLSEFLIQRIIEPKAVLDACYDIVTFATRRRLDRRYRRLSSELMKFSTLQRFFKHRSPSDFDLARHFSKLSNDKNINNEPLFWLQYAILMKKSGQLSNARLFLNTGYERAEDLKGFKTFQLDTQALSIYMLQEAESVATSVEGLDEIVDALKTVVAMLGDQSHRHYAVEVIGEAPYFIEARRTRLKDPEKVLLVFELNRTAQALAALSEEDKIMSGSELVRASIEKAIQSLL